MRNNLISKRNYDNVISFLSKYIKYIKIRTVSRTKNIYEKMYIYYIYINIYKSKCTKSNEQMNDPLFDKTTIYLAHAYLNQITK